MAGCSQQSSKGAWELALQYEPENISSIQIDRYGGPVIEIVINSQRIPTTFDTGNMSNVLIDSSLADSLELTVVGTHVRYNSAGESIGSYRTFAGSEFTAFGEIRDSVVLQEDRRGTLPALIGPRYLPGCRFTIDYQRQMMAIAEGPIPEDHQRGFDISIVRSPRFPRLILIQARINGTEVLMEIDTGKSRSCVDPALVSRLNLPAVEHGYRVDSVVIGGFTFAVPAAKELSFEGLSEDLPIPIESSVGSDILREVILTVDYCSGVVNLQ